MCDEFGLTEEDIKMMLKQKVLSIGGNEELYQNLLIAAERIKKRSDGDFASIVMIITETICSQENVAELLETQFSIAFTNIVLIEDKK